MYIIGPKLCFSLYMLSIVVMFLIICLNAFDQNTYTLLRCFLSLVHSRSDVLYKLYSYHSMFGNFLEDLPHFSAKLFIYSSACSVLLILPNTSLSMTFLLHKLDVRFNVLYSLVYTVHNLFSLSVSLCGVFILFTCLTVQRDHILRSLNFNTEVI